MRLIEIQQHGTLKLCHYTNNIPPYTILSHTWAQDHSSEVLYDDLLADKAHSKPQYHKLEFCRDRTIADGFKYFWIDTCNINKSDNSELTESINSMFRWYQNAQRCYVYLTNVAAKDQDVASSSAHWRVAFRQCRWFQRGWTLQELLAPRSVQFFSEDGVFLGDKHSLEDEIVAISGIPAEALRASNLQDFGLEERFQWASGRHTAKEEDEAYCLLGLFGIFMPLIYGEGREHARKRLENEVSALRARDLEVLEWLSPLNFTAQQQDFYSARAPGTGTWFVEEKTFQEWLHGPSQTLFCPGMPGAGKTMVATFAIHHLQTLSRTMNLGIAYAFCSYGDSNTHRVLNLFTAMLKQLAIQDSKALRILHALYEKHRRTKTRPALDEIFITLTKVCALFSRAIIVVDALDECRNDYGERDRLMQQLFDLQHTAKVNLLFTSRFVSNIEENYAQALQIEIRASDSDIRQYVMEQMPTLPSFVLRNEELQKKICNDIAAGADGMFLLVRFYVDSLRHKTTSKKLKTALETFGGLNALGSAYEEARNRIEHQVAEHRDLAKQVLSWMTYTSRPLRVEEIRHALAIEPGDPELDPDNMPDINEVVAVCAGLVTVDEESGIIRLVHYTTQDYLQRIRDEWLPNAQVLIATACVAYLSCMFSTRDDPGTVESYWFGEYAASRWFYHLHAIQDKVDCDLILEFLSDSSVRRRYCQYFMENQLHTSTPLASSRSSALHLASFFDLEYYVSELLQVSSVRADNRDSVGKTPLAYAAECGHAGVVRLLLASGTASLDSLDTDGATALWLAARNGHLLVVRQLIDKHATVNLTNKARYSALMSAATEGHDDITSLLLATDGISINSKDLLGRIALHLASRHGHVKVVKQLLDTGKADINCRNFQGRTPLMSAAQEGHEDVVGILLQCPDVCVDLKDDQDRNALIIAASEEWPLVLRQLLGTGKFEINAQDTKGVTALMSAARQGHQLTVQELLQAKGIDVDCRDDHGYTPFPKPSARKLIDVGLQLTNMKYVDTATDMNTPDANKEHNKPEPDNVNAVADDRTTVSQLVEQLAEIANINISEKYVVESTPLICAALEGHLHVVELLLATDKADINAKCKDGWTPLMYAAAAGEIAVIKRLIATTGIDVNARDKYGFTALVLASCKNHKDIVDCLLAAEGIIDTRETMMAKVLESAIRPRAGGTVPLPVSFSS